MYRRFGIGCSRSQSFNRITSGIINSITNSFSHIHIAIVTTILYIVIVQLFHSAYIINIINTCTIHTAIDYITIITIITIIIQFLFNWCPMPILSKNIIIIRITLFRIIQYPIGPICFQTTMYIFNWCNIR